MQKSWIALAGAGLLLTIAPAAPAKPPAKDSKKPAGKTAPVGKTVTTKSGLKYVDLKVGTGAMPKMGQDVTVNYTGKLTNGTVFDASSKHVSPGHPHGEPFTFTLGGGPNGNVIPAWNEGVSTMRVGGKRKLICPPDLAYGPDGRPPAIPGNSTLIFEVELLSIK